jgi:hydrogenase maturation protease
VHEVSLVDLMDIARLTDSCPRERVLVAVQPKEIGWGDSLTPEVETAIGEIASASIELLDSWPTPEDRHV